MKLINKKVAKKLFETLDESEKERVIYALNEDPLKYGELFFQEFFNYLEITLASNTNWDLGFDAVAACEELQESDE